MLVDDALAVVPDNDAVVDVVRRILAVKSRLEDGKVVRHRFEEFFFVLQNSDYAREQRLGTPEEIPLHANALVNVRLARAAGQRLRVEKALGDQSVLGHVQIIVYQVLSHHHLRAHLVQVLRHALIVVETSRLVR